MILSTSQALLSAMLLLLLRLALEMSSLRSHAFPKERTLPLPCLVSFPMRSSLYKRVVEALGGDPCFSPFLSFPLASFPFLSYPLESLPLRS